MFRSYIDQAKMTVSTLASKAAGRAVIGALLLVAAGFALAAIAVGLIEAFGAVAAYALLAGAFALVALVASIFVAANERHQQAVMRGMEAERSSVFSSTLAAAAPMALAQGVGLLGRRTPLALIGLAIGGLYLSGAFRERAPSRD